MNLAYRASNTDRRLGLLLTAFVHLALVAGWLAVRTLPAPASQPDGLRSRLLWIPLQLPKLKLREPEPTAPPAPRREAAAPRLHSGPALSLPPLPAVTPSPSPADSAPAAPATSAAPAANADASPQAAPQKPSAAQILQQAKRDIGSIAKALRKENNPYIAAPLDSPQLRMQQGMERAHAMARPGLFEAPKIEELVNNTGDGARRSRVITGNGTYCLTERATNTDVEMIEHHGKLRITNCPAHEDVAKPQAWRTLRD